MRAKYPTYVGGRYAVYRILDTAGALLYVGVTRNFRERMYAHAAEKDWWGEIDAESIRIEWFASAEEASERERYVISTENPRYNRAGKNGQRGTRYTHHVRPATGFTHPTTREEFDAFIADQEAYIREIDGYLDDLSKRLVG